MDHKAIAKAALRRHDHLLRATRELVDARLPQLTSVDAGLPKTGIGKTKPKSRLTKDDVVTDHSKRGLSIVSNHAPQSSNPVDACLHQLTPVDAGLPISQFRKTNPPTPVSSLTPRQLAAARLLAQGRTLSAVAQDLHLTRQGLWKWRRDPAFIAEVNRLHELLAKTNPIPGRR